MMPPFSSSGSGSVSFLLLGLGLGLFHKEAVANDEGFLRGLRPKMAKMGTKAKAPFDGCFNSPRLPKAAKGPKSNNRAFDTCTLGPRNEDLFADDEILDMVKYVNDEVPFDEFPDSGPLALSYQPDTISTYKLLQVLHRHWYYRVLVSFLAHSRSK